MSTSSPSAVPSTQPPRLAIQAFWLMVARTTAFLLTLALPLILVRLFSADQFGVYRQLFVLIATSQNMMLFGVGVSAFYFLPRMPDFRREIVFNIVAYHFCIGALFMLLLMAAPRILTLMLGNEALIPFAAVVGVVIWMNLFASFFEIVATANQDVLYSTAFIILVQLTRGILIVAAVYQFRSIEAVLYALVIQNLLQSAALIWYLHYRFPLFWRHRSRDIARQQFRYILPFGIAAIVYSLQMDMHNYVVANSFGPAQYALYAVGTSQIPLIAILRDSVSSVMQARMSKLQHENNHSAMLSLLLHAWRTLGLAFIPAFTGLMLLRNDFISVLYTSKYAGSVPIFQVNLLLLLINIFVIDSAVRALAEHRLWFVRLRFLVFLLQVLLSFTAIRYFGMVGALAALLISIGVEIVCSVCFIFRLLGFRRQNLTGMRDLSKIAAAAVAAGIMMEIALTLFPDRPPIRLGGGIIIYGLSYAVIVLSTSILTSEEKSLIDRWTRRLFRIHLPGFSAR
jgi:O-antigen/teichoic acid export membrane protein